MAPSPELRIEHSPRTSNGTSIVRAVAAILIILPAIGLFILFQYASPNVEVWITEKTNGYFRRDAFDGVAKIMPVFMVMFGYTSLLASCLVIAHREDLVFILMVGPALGSAVYLLGQGFSDPAWWSFLACLTIGMVAGTSVTGIWWQISKPQKPSTGMKVQTGE